MAWRLQPGFVGRFPQLRLVCSIGAGAEKLLVADLPDHVAVTRIVDPQQSQAMAQYVVAVTLAHLRELPRYAMQQADGRWQRHRQRAVATSRVGLLGQGEIAPGHRPRTAGAGVCRSRPGAAACDRCRACRACGAMPATTDCPRCSRSPTCSSTRCR